MADNETENSSQDAVSVSQDSVAIVTQVFTGDDFNDSACGDLDSLLAEN